MLRHVAVESFGTRFCDQRLQFDHAFMSTPATLALDPLHAAAMEVTERKRLHALGLGRLALGYPLSGRGFIAHFNAAAGRSAA